VEDIRSIAKLKVGGYTEKVSNSLPVNAPLELLRQKN
jgi:hypothetical protein